jgi:DNA repair exonuclease SbcCD ATPase subunit
MKREDLEKLELSAEQIDQIMALHGKGVEKAKADLAALTTERDGLKKQLTDANAAIEGFKKLDVDSIKAAADEWKTKAEQAQKDAEAQIQALKFDHALDQALAGAKAKNSKAVKALLSMEGLKLNDADGSIVGLKEQLEKIQSENDYLFESDQPAPKIVAGGGNPNPSSMSTFEAAARRGAGLPVQGK